VARRLFGTAGIRGRTNEEITPALALEIAQAFGTRIRRAKKGAGRVCVAHDPRYGARTLAHAAVAGLSASGSEVIDYGILPAGAFSLNIVMAKADGGVMVTGSHMPYDRIGLLVFLEDGSCAPFEATDEIEEIRRAGSAFRVKPEEIGAIHQGSIPAEVYATELLRHVDRRAIAARSPKVLVDPANGSASTLAREVFERVGCQVVSINASFQPVPNRPSEPRSEAVEEAKSLAKVLKVDLGVCLDMDADRALFLTGRGEAVSEDASGGILARAELKPDDLCVVPVNSSGLIEYVAQRAGARLEYCRVGQPETIKAVKALRAVFSYEESGKYYFARSFLWSDGVFSALKMLETMSKERRSLPELAESLPAFHQAKESVPVPDESKARVYDDAVRIVRAEGEPGVRDVEIDGFKRIYKDHAWLLLRPSGTEPLIRVFSDASSVARAAELVSAGSRAVRAALAAQPPARPPTSA
jgi:phosphomannomutase/phosphoglucomutase